MSKIKVDELESVDGLQGITLTNLLKALPTAWVKFDASGTLIDSYNISTVIRDSVGRYTLTFTVPMDNADYIVNATSANLGTDPRFGGVNSSNAIDVNGFSVQYYNDSGALGDAVGGYVVVHGGKN